MIVQRLPRARELIKSYPDRGQSLPLSLTTHQPQNSPSRMLVLVPNETVQDAHL